jgi:hypothetical protein
VHAAENDGLGRAQRQFIDARPRFVRVRTIHRELDFTRAFRRIGRMGLLDRFRMTDQVAIVTGAGRGIGRGIALAFAEMGADVVCAARTEREIEDTAASARRLGRRALAVPCDVTDPRISSGSSRRALRARPRRPPREQRGRIPAPVRARHGPAVVGVVLPLQPHVGVPPDAPLPSPHARARRRYDPQHLVRRRPDHPLRVRRLRHREGRALVHDEAAGRRVRAARAA